MLMIELWVEVILVLWEELCGNDVTPNFDILLGWC